MEVGCRLGDVAQLRGLERPLHEKHLSLREAAGVSLVGERFQPDIVEAVVGEIRRRVAGRAIALRGIDEHAESLYLLRRQRIGFSAHPLVERRVAAHDRALERGDRLRDRLRRHAFPRIRALERLDVAADIRDVRVAVGRLRRAGGVHRARRAGAVERLVLDGRRAPVPQENRVVAHVDEGWGCAGHHGAHESHRPRKPVGPAALGRVAGGAARLPGAAQARVEKELFAERRAPRRQLVVVRGRHDRGQQPLRKAGVSRLEHQSVAVPVEHFLVGRLGSKGGQRRKQQRRKRQTERILHRRSPFA